jgi:Putative Actinobacterial Holin-X, holin superfamily III
MLKPADPGPQSERPIGELVSELIDEGKAYARAELGLVKAIAAAKGKALAWPAGLFLLALIVVQSAVTILGVGIFMAALRPLGPILAALLASLIFLAIAGAIGWYCAQRLRRDL